MKTLHLLVTALLFILFMPVAAPARQPGGLQVTGRILSIDHTSRVITLEEDGGKEPRKLVYAARTTFWSGASAISAETLKPGMRVQVTVHNPVFGPDFVTRIIQLQSSRYQDQHRPS